MRQAIKQKTVKFLGLMAVLFFMVLAAPLIGSQPVHATPLANFAAAASNYCGTTSQPAVNAPVTTDCPTTTKFHCGGGNGQEVKIAFDIGCKGQGNPITDAAFAIIRFLSYGVGLIIVGSMTFAGIQYTASRGDPKATAEAVNRIRSNVVAFIIYAFSFAILNFLIPKGFFGQ